MLGSIAQNLDFMLFKLIYVRVLQSNYMIILIFDTINLSYYDKKKIFKNDLYILK